MTETLLARPSQQFDDFGVDFHLVEKPSFSLKEWFYNADPAAIAFTAYAAGALAFIALVGIGKAIENHIEALP